MAKRNTQTEALFEAWAVLMKFRWRFVLPAFVATALVLAASLGLPRKYRAEAVFERRTDMVLSEIINRGAARSYQDPRNSLANEVVGDPAIDELLARLEDEGLLGEVPQADLSALRSALEHKTTVSYDISSNELDRIRITFVGEDPEIARAVANGFVRNYIERTRKQNEDRLTDSSKFFSDEAKRVRAQIETMENEQLTFEINHADLLPDNPNSVQALLTDADASLEAASEHHTTAKARYDALRKQRERTPKTIPSVVHTRNPEIGRLNEQKRELEEKLAEYRGILKMKEKHPDVVALRQQIAKVQAEIDATPREIVSEKHDLTNPKYGEIELRLTDAKTELEAAARKKATLEEQVAVLTAQSNQLFSVRSDYRKLTRKIEDAQREMSFWEENQRLVDMALAAESGDRGVRLDLIKECAPITKPVSPNLMQVVLAAMLVGLITGGVSVFYSYRTDETIGDSESLNETFNLPVFGAVSEIISRKQRRLRRLRNMIVYPINGAVMAAVLIGLTGLIYLSLEKPEMMSLLRDDPQAFVEEGVEKVTEKTQSE